MDRVLPATDESHRVKRPAGGIAAQAVNRHDSRVLQVAGDLGFEQKPRSQTCPVHIPRLDLLDRNFTWSSRSRASQTWPMPPLAYGLINSNRLPWVKLGSSALALDPKPFPRGPVTVGARVAARVAPNVVPGAVCSSSVSISCVSACAFHASRLNWT